MDADTLEDLERRARHGDAAAAKDFLVILRRLAASGSIDAKRVLGQVLLTRPPYGIVEGAAAIFDAARGGDAEAAHLAAILAASGIGTQQNWPVALDFLQLSAERGWALAQATLVALTSDADLASRASEGVQVSGLWKRLCDAVVMGEWLMPAAPVSVFDAPRIKKIPGFLSPPMCEWLIKRSAPLMSRAETIDKAGGVQRVEEIRTGSAMNFNIVRSDVLLVILRARMAAATGLTMSGMEASAVLHYAIGQQYLPHYDFLDPAFPGYRADVATRGPRVATFLIALNDSYEGGETDFPELGWRFKGRTGDALLFWNVDAKGAIDPKTLHAGLPPASGEKFLFSQWVRDRPGALFGPVMPAASGAA